MSNRLGVLVLLSFFILIQSCTKNEISPYDNYVHESIKTNVKGFDPVISQDLYSGLVMGQMYEGLMQYNYLLRPTQVEPSLADGMPQISKDYLTYTFKIKKGVLFHDDPCFKESGGKGREVTSDDFVYSWKRLADPKSHSDGFWIFDGKIKGLTEWRQAASRTGSADYDKSIPGIKASDKYTLVVTLNKPFPQFLYVLTMIGASVLPREAIEAYGPEFQNHPVGTGPYKFKNWVRNAEIILDRNPNYRDERYPSKGEESDQANGLLADAGKRLPLNDGVVFTETPEDQPRWLNFRKGVYDWIEIPKDDFDAAIKDGTLVDEYKNQGIVLNKFPEADVTFHGFSMEDPIVGKNKYLRQAMNLADDADALIKKFYNGRGISAQGPVPPTVTGYDPNRKDPYRQFDLEKARALLKKAGYPDGQGLPEISYEVQNGTNIRQQTEFFQQQMAKIGIKIRINMNTWPEFMEKLRNRKAQMFGVAWSADYPDAENFLQLMYGPNSSPGPNNANYNNPEFNKIFEKASVMPDGPARNKLYQKMVDIVNEDCPYIFEAHRTAWVLSHGWFKNYKRNLIILNYIKYYRIDKDAKTQLKRKL